MLSVQDFGAKGDYDPVSGSGTDDSAAFAACYLAAVEFYATDPLYAASIYFPPGIYLITQANFLGQIDFSALAGSIPTRLGVTLWGDGWGTRIYFKPTSVGTDVWIYDNGSSASANNRLIYPLFKNLGFFCDVSNLSDGATMNGFREFGSPGNATQGFHFDRCRFVCVDYGSSDTDIAKAGTFLQTLGTVNADGTLANLCCIRGWGTLLDLGTNSESVVHNFFNCNVEVIYGDVFKVAGGSSVNVIGGSWTLMSQSAAYLIAFRPTTASIAGTFNFQGGRTELNTRTHPTHPPDPPESYSAILLMDARGQASAFQSSFPIINFNGWNFYPTSAVARDTIIIDAAFPAKVNFNGCALGFPAGSGLAQYNRVRVDVSHANLQTTSNGPFAELSFNDGDAIPFGQVTFVPTNAVAKVSARKCRGTLDYDLTANGRGSSVIGQNIPLKTVMLWGAQWPDVGLNATITTTLPPNCLIKAARFSKAANGGTATAGYQLAFTDSNLSAYCSSTIGAQNLLHSAAVDNLYVIADTPTTQGIFIVAVAGHQGSAQAVAMGAGDYAAVDYW